MIVNFRYKHVKNDKYEENLPLIIPTKPDALFYIKNRMSSEKEVHF